MNAREQAERLEAQRLSDDYGVARDVIDVGIPPPGARKAESGSVLVADHRPAVRFLDETGEPIGWVG